MERKGRKERGGRGKEGKEEKKGKKEERRKRRKRRKRSSHLLVEGEQQLLCAVLPFPAHLSGQSGETESEALLLLLRDWQGDSGPAVFNKPLLARETSGSGG